jgi:transposase
VSRKKVYTEEFKKQAVQLAIDLKNVSKASKQLGIRDVNIHKWKQQFNLKNSNITESEHLEIKRLKKEVEELKKANYILSRAAAFFSQDHLK